MNTPHDDQGSTPPGRSRNPPGMHSGLKLLLIVFLGIPFGLVALATLVLGVCLLSSR